MTKCLVILTMVLIIQLFFSTSVNAGNVCSNDGHCKNLGICKRSGYCRCEDGYSGAKCNISASKQCGPNATCLNGGYCGAISQYCRCADGWTGDLCNSDINECLYNNCHNGGTCNDLVARSTCTCVDGYGGNWCSYQSNECSSNPCQNGGTCNDFFNRFTCNCRAGFLGTLCETDFNECASNPCQNGGTCNDSVNSFNCTCVPGYNGSFCEADIDECASNPCQNGGTCNETINAFNCTCPAGYNGTFCETDIDECASNPCQNGGTCNETINLFNCTCPAGYNGTFCETDIDECASNPCQNGGTCNDSLDFFNCTCPAGYNGTFCETDIDECASNPCQNGGTCNHTINFFNCTCPAGYNGTFCETDIDECASNPCQNGGTCNDSLDFFNCTCPAGYNGTFCETDIDECASNPCQNGGTCNHTINAFNCTCPPGYNGTFCETDIDECASNPCQNGGTCNHTINAFNCTCPAGYNGTFCETDIDECASNPCQNGGTCNDSLNFFNCTCPAGYNGTFCETDIDECASNPCQNGGTCNHTINFFNCTCPTGYNGTFCETDIDECASNPCQNGGTCNDSLDFFNCTCPAGYNGTFCETDIDECASNPCQNGGTCNHTINAFNCTCPAGYNGTFCETDIDECASNPCQNGGTCNHTINAFNCTCPAGYNGTFCESDVDDCASNPCQNGGTCNDNINFFNCTCPAGYNGTFCETDIDECASNPCQNGGTCNDFVNSFNCTCLPGYNGTFCEPGFDECLSNPCQNGATCNDKVNSFNCTCPEMYTGVLCEIDVGFVLIPLSAHEFGQPMSVEWNMTEGTNLTVTVFYNEFPCCNSSVLTDNRGRCICLVSDSDSFDTDGVVDIRAVASNLVFSATKITQVEVLKKIVNVSISVLTTDTDFKSRIETRRNLENIFPAEYPVTFNFSYVHSPLRLLEWTLACSISGVTKYTQFFFDKVFPGNVSQRCNITLVVKNNVSAAIASRSIELKESILFTSMTTDGPKKENQTITSIISFGKFGTDTCMTVDLGDNSSLLVFGGISCETKFDVSQINPNIVTNPRLIFSEKNSKTRQIVVHHRYRQPGTYSVNMNVSNDISIVTENTVAVVLGFDCKNPNVTITGLTLNFSNTLNAARVYRSVPIALSTENQLSCEKTRRTTTSWTVFKFNDDPRSTLNVESLRKTPYHTDRSSPDLLLPERYLPYGFYQVSARVEMQDLPDVFGSDLLYFQVVQTPWIKAAATSGSFYTVPFGNLGSLNASNSFDPDFVGTEGMMFSWYCRDVDDDEFLLSNLTHEVLLSIPQANDSFLPPSADSDGCFGTGRGHLNETKYLLELDTRTMVEDKTYTISLVVLKNHPEFGLRQDISNIYFYVTKGVPPELHTSCAKNCRDKIVPDKKIILESSCSKFCYGELQFSWSLYYFDDINMLEPYNLTDLNVIERDQLQKMASNPIEELNIAIKSNVLQSGRKYIMSFRATRPNGVYGELRYTMLINTPPQNGNCSVFPLSGVALETSFTFSCEKWKDPDSPLTFEFSYKKKEIGNIFSYRTVASGQRISVIDWLPNGDEHDNYRLNVIIDVKDNLGSKSTQDFTLKVVPPSLDVKKLQDISGNIFDSLMQSNGPGAISLASSVGSVLNYMAQNVESNATVMDQSAQKEAAKQIRAHILTSLSTVSAKDMSSLIQISGAVGTLTEKTDELLPEAQDAALKICGSLADSLKGFSDGDTGFENVQKGASKIVGVIGQIMDGFSANAALSTESGNRTSSGQTKSCVHLINKMQNTLLDNLVTNEGAVNIETNKLSLQVERVSTKELGKNANSVKNSRFLAPLATSLGLKEIVMDPNNTYLQMQAVDVKMAVFDKNPFSWDRSSKTITSFVVDVALESKLNISSNFSEEITITLPRDSSQFPRSNYFFMKPSEINTTTNTKQYLKFHCFTRSSNYTSMNFELHPDDLGIHFTVYVKKGSKPDIKNKDFDMYFELPDFNGCTINDNDVSTINMSDRDKRGPIHIDPKNCSRHPYTVFISNIDFNGTGKYCFAVEHVQYMQNNTESDDNNTSSNSRRRRSVSCEVGKKRVRRSCVIIPTVPPKPTDPPAIEILVADNLGFDGKFFFPNQTPNYNLTMFESSCVFWDVVNETWIGEGCRVASGTSKDQILCYCNHLTSFGSDLLVAPNPIDFDSVFKNFDSLSDNVAVLILISVILGFYIIGVLWTRRADNKDLSMLGPKIVHPEGSYSYLITLYTGQRQEAGTTARVVFKMSGSEDDTSPVRLRDRRRPCFKRGQDNAFVVSYPRGVGDLNYVQVWHDNSGSSPSWYLSRLSVKDLQTGQMWSFVCENWLAVECEDGQVCRVLPVASDEERINFRHLFTVHTIKGLSDGHIWFSIVSRPPSSNFTRVQRLSCALCLLCSTMITSAMFYNMGSQGPSPFLFHIGSLVIDWKPFVIGLQSSIIIMPINVALVQIFRNLRPKEEKKSNNCSVENDNDDQESQIEEGENLQPAKGKLPYWFIYIAYGVCYLASATAIFFTLLYSIQWGKTTSRQWVIAMVTAFFQSVLLLQPIKVALGAIILALVIRKPCDTDEKCSDVSLNELTEKEKIAMKIRIKTRKAKYYSPPDPAKSKRARIKRLKEIKMNAVLKEIVVFFVFLLLLMEVAHHHRDPNTFLMTKTLTETFEEVDAYSIDLAAISDEDSLWMWARETLIPGLYAGDWYNGAKSKKGYIANMQGYLVGVPRIRLLRVKKDSCRVTSYFNESIPHCYTGYSITDEEDQSFNVGWQPLGTGTLRSRRDIRDLETEKKWLEMMQYGTERYREKRRQKRATDPINSGKNRRKKKRLLKTSNPKIYVVNGNAVLPGGKILSCLERWRHQTMTKLRGFPYWGTIAMYSGGGYVANLGYEPVVAYTVVADLHSNGWIDVQTRAVFVEFTVYNANTNLFGIISIFIEFPSSSSAITRVQYQVARFYLHMTAGQTLAHVLVIFFMLYFLYREGKFVYKQRWAYFKSFWNWVEIILVFCEFATIVLFLARLYEVDQNLIQLRENPNDYVGFQYAGNADAALSYVLGVLVFFYILRFLRLLRFNKSFLVIGKTLSRISKPILSFCIPFFFAFVAFGLFAFSIFGSQLEEYSSFVMTMVTQFSMTLGDFDFEALVIVNPILAPLYFFAFIGLNVIVLMNVFLAIINDSYAEIQKENTKIENEYEILDYVTKRFIKSIGWYRGKGSPKKKDKKRKNKKKSKDNLIPASSQRCFDALDRRAKRLDKLIKAMERDPESVMEERFLFLMEIVMEDDDIPKNP